jgi:predicted DNA binding CopG/RHH family protein
LSRLKAKALQEWMPYQILINHILHKYIQWEMIPVYA